MLIWGTKSVKSKLGSGEFYCPHCQSTQSYKHVKARRHGHVYWIPLFPIGEGVEYVECLRCGNTWKPQILSHATPSESDVRALLEASLIAVAIASASPDGTLSVPGMDVITRVLQPVVSVELSAPALENLSREAGPDPLDKAVRILERIAGVLPVEAKEFVIQTSILVSLGTGNVGASQRLGLMRVAGVLGISDTHMMGIFAKVSGRAAA